MRAPVSVPDGTSLDTLARFVVNKTTGPDAQQPVPIGVCASPRPAEPGVTVAPLVRAAAEQRGGVSASTSPCWLVMTRLSPTVTEVCLPEETLCAYGAFV